MQTIQFDTTFSDGAVEARMQWDVDNQTVSIGMPGGNVNGQLFQEDFLPRAKAAQDLVNGTLVRITDAIGSNPIVDVSDPDSITTVGAIGMTTEDIDNGQFGYVTTRGLVRGTADQPIDTSSYPASTTLLMDDDGTWTDTIPDAPRFTVYVGTVIRSHVELGEIYVTIVAIPRLRGLSDVYSPTTPNVGEVIAWHATNERWEIVPNVQLNPETGTVRFGDATNNATWDTDGTLTLNGTATVWDDLRVPFTAIRIGPAGDPDFAQVIDDGAGSTGVYAYHFDKATEEQLHFSVQLPHSWKEGSTIYPHIHWMPSDTDTGSVVWGLEYTWASIDTTFSNSTILTVTEAAGGTALEHFLTSWAGIDGTGETHSSMLMCRVFRDADNLSDDYDADAIGLEVDFHYEINQLGDDEQPGA